jgi:hypothetical protein
MLVELPCRQSNKTEWIQIVRQVSHRAECALLDLADLLPAERLGFTDAVHLDAKSAVLCLESLLGSCALLK